MYQFGAFAMIEIGREHGVNALEPNDPNMDILPVASGATMDP